MMIFAAVVAYIVIGLATYSWFLFGNYRKAMNMWNSDIGGGNKPTVQDVALDHIDDMFIAIGWPLFWFIYAIFAMVVGFSFLGVMIVETIYNWNYKSPKE